MTDETNGTALIRTTLALTPAQRVYLEAQALANDTSLSWVVRRALRAEMERPTPTIAE